MSGRKYSRVELANSVRELLASRIVAEQACAHSKALVSTLQDSVRTTQALRSTATAVAAALNVAAQKLRELTENLSETALMSQSMEQVRSTQQRLQQLTLELEEIGRRCRSGSISADLRMDLTTLLHEVGQRQAELLPWLKDTYEAFHQITGALIAQVDQQLASSGSIEGMEDVIARQIASFAGMQDRAAERQIQDAQRKYVATALIKVCHDMGFATRVLEQNSPLEDTVIEVNTHAYGIIEFRLMLEGTIRSLSEMISNSCSANFKQIEEGLRNLYVGSEFCYEGDQSPVCLTGGMQKIETSIQVPIARTEKTV